MLDVNQIEFSYGKRKILHEVNFALQKGEIASLIGSSGSGKTTLFKLMTGLLNLEKGSIIIGGEPLPRGALFVTYMMQEDLLLPWRTILENMLLTSELGNQGSLTKQRKEEASALLEELGLAGYENMYPEELSGGMRQRVSLARAMLPKKPVLLLDEPFGGLDIGLREQMYNLLRRIQEKYGTTILMITHDFRDALSLSDKVFLLDKGRIKQTWSIPPKLHVDALALGQLHEELRYAFLYT
jgi:ABC-type nitrate/sulfonate/bicarbonate transport system ATPase subunit